MDATALEDAIEAAHAALDDDRPERARAALHPALAAADDAPAGLRAEALGLAAVAARAEGELREARELSDRALAIGSLPPELIADLLEDRAEIELASRAPASAASSLRRAIGLRGPTSAEPWMALADALLQVGDHEGVIEALAHAEPLASRGSDAESVALIAELRGDVALALADAHGARSAYLDAGAKWRALGDPSGEVRAWLGAARAGELADDRDAILAALRALESIDADAAGRADAIDEVRSWSGG